MTVTNYGFIGLLLLGAIGFALAPVAVVALIAPRRGGTVKAETYECGVPTTGETWIRFRIQYYVFALMFVVFDVETVLLYPWAVAYGGLGVFALVEMAIFLVVLAAGLAYAWGKGVLHWA